MTGIKIFFAAAFGALIGAITGLQIAENSPLAAIVGFLVGGLVGYLSYEFKVIVIAVKKAWREALQFSFGKLWASAKPLGLIMLATFAYTSTILIFIIFLALPAPGEIYWNRIPMAAGVIWIFFGVLPFVGIVATGGLELQSYQKSKLRWICRNTNPFAVFFYWPFRGAYFVIRWLIVDRRHIWNGIVSAGVQIGRFLRSVYIGIHSDIRLMLFIDSGLGALFGYFFESPMIGATAGGILGVINYYVVATFLLGLTPKGVERS